VAAATALFIDGEDQHLRAARRDGAMKLPAQGALALAKQSEGKEVRIAISGPDIEPDALLDFIGERNRDDRRAASISGESRAAIKAFLDETGMNGQALSWCRVIVKKLDKDDGQHKAMDVIRSLKKALPYIEQHVTGNTTADMFDSDGPEPVVPITEDDLAFLTADIDHDPGESDPDDDGFDEAVDEALGDDNVVPFGTADVA
jgi:hypothetical protein